MKRYKRYFVLFFLIGTLIHPESRAETIALIPTGSTENERLTNIEKAVNELIRANLELAKKVRTQDEKINQLNKEVKMLEKTYNYRKSVKKRPNASIKTETTPTSTNERRKSEHKKPSDRKKTFKKIVLASLSNYKTPYRLRKIYNQLLPLKERGYEVKGYISPRKKLLVLFTEASPGDIPTFRRLGYRDAFVSRIDNLPGKCINSLEDLSSITGILIE